jgi:ADP-dependent NAD(P)H-hydrate dehydratase / NAD(P)H-hydrate epimerase
MLPLLVSSLIRQADAYTIAHEPIAAIDLMERASKAFVGWFINHFTDKRQSISVYCGTGNNGGDGLAIARMLKDHSYQHVNVKIASFSSKSSEEFNTNLHRLIPSGIAITEIKQGDDLPSETSSVIIDAMLGTGLNKPLTGDYERLVDYLNTLERTVVAVDVPTGFFSDGETDPHAPVLKADLVITFQQPRINFLLPESAPYIDCWEVVGIGLSEDFIRSSDSPYQLIEERDIRKRLRPRHRFSNKGTYGHALVVAGQPQTMGAALLCSSACASAGAGLVTACIPSAGLSALNSYHPEIMAILRGNAQQPEIDWEKYSTVAVGPGLGMDERALSLLTAVLKNFDKPIVIDADGLNLLAGHPDLWASVPGNSILTPHVKEFDRLFGSHSSWWQRLQTARQKAKEHKVFIVLKNNYTISITPQGRFFFNATGNAAMASGGMGDVLTGIIAALLAQGYSPEEACILGNYLHGKAGDELALPNRMYVVLPGRLLAQLPVTMAKLMA